MKTTNEHIKFWRERKIDWGQSYSSTWNHPHRQMVIDALRKFQWRSIYEVGCASGPNLIRIKREFPGAQVGGIDPSEDAINFARATFGSGSLFDVGTGENMMLSDRMTDVVLSDMALIYVGPKNIEKYLKEMRRIARARVVLVEFYHPNFLKRLLLWWKTGYYAHDYRALLTKLGFYDIEFKKITPELWPEADGRPGGEPQKTFGWVISAKL